MKCEICGREFKNYISLGTHLGKRKIITKEYYDRFLKKEDEGICPVCGKETSFKNLREGYFHFCSYRCAKLGENNPNYGKHLTEETKKKLSDASKGENNPFYNKRHSEKTKKKISDVNKGRHLSEETKKKMSNAKKGENHPNYKGGISLKEFKDAFGMEPEEWKKLAQEVRTRDNFTCQLCGKKNATDVHHIMPRRIKIDNSLGNLITLCKSCHTKVEHLTDKYLAEGKDPREIFFQCKI